MEEQLLQQLKERAHLSDEQAHQAVTVVMDFKQHAGDVSGLLSNLPGGDAAKGMLGNFGFGGKDK